MTRRRRHAGRALLRDHPGLAIAGSLAAKKTVPASAGTFPTDGGLFVGLLVGVILIVGGLTFFPAARARTRRRAPRDDRRPDLCRDVERPHRDERSPPMHRAKLRQRLADSGLVDPKILGPAVGASFRKLDPRVADQEPGDVRGRGRGALTTVLFLRDLVTGGPNLGFAFQIILWLWFTVLFANFAEAVAEGRGKAQADALRRTRTETQAKLLDRARARRLQARARPEPQGRRHRAGRGRRHHPVRRRGDRGRRLGQRGRHHRRIGAGDPRSPAATARP